MADILPLTLIASDHFASGNAGWLTPSGVWRVDQTSQRPAGALLVRALETVRAGTYGKFCEATEGS